MPLLRRLGLAASAAALLAPLAFAEGEASLVGARVRVDVALAGGAARERVSIKDGASWVVAADTSGSVTSAQRTDGLVPACRVTDVQGEPKRILIRGECGAEAYERAIELGAEPDLVAVSVSYTPASGTAVSAVEDRLTF